MSEKIELNEELGDYARQKNQEFREEIQRIQEEAERQKKGAHRELWGVIDTLGETVGAPDDWEFFCNDEGVGFKPPESEDEGENEEGD